MSNEILIMYNDEHNNIAAVFEKDILIQLKQLKSENESLKRQYEENLLHLKNVNKKLESMNSDDVLQHQYKLLKQEMEMQKQSEIEIIKLEQQEIKKHEMIQLQEEMELRKQLQVTELQEKMKMQKQSEITKHEEMLMQNESKMNRMRSECLTIIKEKETLIKSLESQINKLNTQLNQEKNNNSVLKAKINQCNYCRLSHNNRKKKQH